MGLKNIPEFDRPDLDPRIVSKQLLLAPLYQCFTFSHLYHNIALLVFQLLEPDDFHDGDERAVLDSALLLVEGLEQKLVLLILFLDFLF